MDDLIQKIEKGFESLKVAEAYKQAAKGNLEKWLFEEQFGEYRPQIVHFIEEGYWDYLLDCFYQIIPFGTGGRRGEVGIGPNRINQWTIQSSAQGHSQYLIKHWGEEASKRGVVLAWDVREFLGNKFMDANLPNPVMNLTGDKLAYAAAGVYLANNIPVWIFDGPRTTPELSFAVRYLKAVSGDVFSASHNPPEHNGKKVYDETGGQLVPPDDEALVNEVAKATEKIVALSRAEVVKHSMLKKLNEEIDEAYIKAASAVSLGDNREVKIAYTPLHGCGSSSVLKVLRHLGFEVNEDPETINPSGRFEHVTFHIPNPEVVQSFDIPLKYATEIGADILLNSDPDADRIGIMVNHQGEWKFLNGNEMAAILTQYVIEKKSGQVKDGVLIKTEVTSGLLTKMAKVNKVEVIGDLLVGFKYIGVEMNKLEQQGKIESFLFGAEESHGYIAGNYTREKDAVVAAVWMSELAAGLKKEQKTLVDYLEDIYEKYGYFANYLTEIRMPGAEGKAHIDAIQNSLRSQPPGQIGDFKVKRVEDCLERLPIVSETDRSSKNMLVFYFEPMAGVETIKVTVRPSGTEPKSKMYIEIGGLKLAEESLVDEKQRIKEMVGQFERAFMKYCYKIIGVDFPDRGFLLFWQLPLTDKLKYFEIEPEITKLKEVTDVNERKTKLNELLQFLGADPIQKIDSAFAKEYGVGVEKYLGI